LLPLNSTYQFRINAAYVNDFQQQQGNVSIKFYLPADTISINEQNKFHSNLNLLQTDLSLMANTSTYYLKNVLRFQGLWSAESSQLQTNKEIKQRLSNPFFNLSNDFRLLKTKANYIIEWGSYIGYTSLPQQLNVAPGLYPELVNGNFPYDVLIQQASLQTFYTDNYVSFRKRKSKFGSQYKLGFNIQSQQFQSDLLVEQSGAERSIADTFQNNLTWKRYRFFSDNNWSYETNKWRLSFSLPINYTKIDYTDTLLKLNTGEKGLLINPSATIMFQLNPKWSINTSASYNQGFGDISGITNGYILKTYRNLSNNNAPLAETKSANISATLTFRNPLKIVFFNTSITFSKNRSNLLYSQRFTGSLETLIALLQNNYTNKTTVSGRFSKYIIDWKTSIGFNYGYTFGNQQQLQQNKLVTFSNKNYSISTSISAKLSSKITTDYGGTYFTYSSKSQLQKTNNQIKSANQSFSFNYFPTNKIIFRVSAEHYYTSNNIAPAQNFYFADLNLRYTPKKSKIDYEITCQNLFKTKAFTTILLMNNVETISQYQLRPRQVLFKLSFAF
ncbi:MAG: TonB-dependent receptor, partial [Chitinophagaceae bacterium]|nr:TonB-dependent receptor [Chitinophagaceae bacterium]